MAESNNVTVEETSKEVSNLSNVDEPIGDEHTAQQEDQSNSSETQQEDQSNSSETQQEAQPNASESKKVSFMLDVESKAIIETMVDSLEGFNMDKLTSLLPSLIKHVENYKNLRGKEKKSLVIKMLNHIIDITDCPGDDAVLDPIMKRMVPGMIDLLIEVNNGKLKLKKKNAFTKLILKCFGK